MHRVNVSQGVTLHDLLRHHKDKNEQYRKDKDKQ